MPARPRPIGRRVFESMALPSLINEVMSGDHAVILRKLVQLRLFVLCAALAIVALLHLNSSWPLNYPLVAGVILAGIIWSLWLLRRVRTPTSGLVIPRELLLDALWLVLVVYFSGRTANPFIYYFLVLIAIGATIFRARIAWIFSLGSIGIYTGFLVLDIQDHFEHVSDDYRIHLLGMWINFVGSSLVTCYFVSKLASALREHQQQLSKFREETLKNEQLIGIATLAASTVHALGTPLSTLTVLLGEIQNTENQQDIQLMLAQIERCKTTMKKLSLLAEPEAEQTRMEPMANLVENLREHYAISQPLKRPNIRCAENCQHSLLMANFLLRHALINLIDNAIQAAKTKAAVNFDCDSDNLTISIGDDGPGLSTTGLQQWGQPQRSGKRDGLGIGAFLANSTIEKLGGTVAIYRHSADTAAPEQAAPLLTQVVVKLPLCKLPLQST
jgi:two-component system sensor histidine kinase RegB